MHGRQNLVTCHQESLASHGPLTKGEEKDFWYAKLQQNDSPIVGSGTTSPLSPHCTPTAAAVPALGVSSGCSRVRPKAAVLLLDELS